MSRKTSVDAVLPRSVMALVLGAIIPVTTAAVSLAAEPAVDLADGTLTVRFGDENDYVAFDVNPAGNVTLVQSEGGVFEPLLLDGQPIPIKNVGKVVIDLGGGDDRVGDSSFGVTEVWIYGGAGNDVIKLPNGTGSKPVRAYGGPGNDQLRAEHAMYVYLYGEGGNDILTGSTDGPNLLDGGPGVNSLSPMPNRYKPQLGYTTNTVIYNQGAVDTVMDYGGNNVYICRSDNSGSSGSLTIWEMFGGYDILDFGQWQYPVKVDLARKTTQVVSTAAGTAILSIALPYLGIDKAILPNQAPLISSFSPATPLSVTAGTSQTFSVSAWDADGDTLTYSWKLDGTPTGDTGASITYSPTTTNAGSHTIQVTASDGKSGSASQTWAVTVILPATPPSITVQPANKTVTVGQPATFAVVATGTAPLSYQWRKNDVNIGGATAASYTTPATTAADNGAKFKVTVTNSAGSAASNEATLSVNPLPTHTIAASAGTGGTISPSGAVIVNQGGSQTFMIAPSGGYQIAGVTVDGAPVGVVSSYTFTCVAANHTISAVFADNSPPALDVTSAMLRGTVGDPGSAVNLTANGSAVTVNADGSWQTEVMLSSGEIGITIVATDAAGNATTKVVTVTK